MKRGEKKVIAKPPIRYCEYCGLAYRRKSIRAKYCCGNCTRYASAARVGVAWAVKGCKHIDLIR